MAALIMRMCGSGKQWQQVANAKMKTRKVYGGVRYSKAGSSGDDGCSSRNVFCESGSWRWSAARPDRRLDDVDESSGRRSISGARHGSAEIESGRKKR